jgi:hypothetical protein
MGQNNIFCIKEIIITMGRGKQKTSSCPGPNRDAGMGNDIFCRSDTQNENFAKGSGRGQKETTQSSE